MTETQLLREMLDRCGVDYEADDDGAFPCTSWHDGELDFYCTEHTLNDGVKAVPGEEATLDGSLDLEVRAAHCTAAEAIETYVRLSD